MIKDPIKVFITYAWEDDNHNNWVRQLGDELLTNGVEAIIDQYDLDLGERIPKFMEQSITGAVYVLVICTPKYKYKADERLGGVGYESDLIAGELCAKANERKYIPILRRGTLNDAIPKFLLGRNAVILQEGMEASKYNENLHKMIMKLKGISRKPPVIVSDEKIDRNEDFIGATIHATVGEYYDDSNSFVVHLYKCDRYKPEYVKGLIAGDIVIADGSVHTIKEMAISPFTGDIVAIMEDDSEIDFEQLNEDDMIARSGESYRICMNNYRTLYLKAADNIIYEDASDIDSETVTVIRGIEKILKIKAEKEKNSIGFDYYATTITLNEKLEIEKIHQGYDPAQ